MILVVLPCKHLAMKCFGGIAQALGVLQPWLSRLTDFSFEGCPGGGGGRVTLGIGAQ